MQNFVHQVFVAVVGIIGTLLTIGTGGVILLLLTDDTSHAGPAKQA